MAAVLLLVTPVQPWYALLLVALAAVASAWWALPIAAASYPLFFATVLHDNGVVVGRLSFGAAALVVAAVAISRRRPPVGSASPEPIRQTVGV
jgi:hypothetical protein